MINSEILRQLVPQEDPEEEYPVPPRLRELDFEDPARRVGLWSAFLRHRISQDIEKKESLLRLIDSSGYVATGIFRVPHEDEKDDFNGFKPYRGFRFGAMLFRAALDGDGTGPFVESVTLNYGTYRAPVMQTLSEFRGHAQSPEGYVAATYVDDVGDTYGITARHVVESFRRGQRVPVECSACDDQAKLRKLAPGLLDAAVVRFPCGGPFSGAANTTRPATEGETVEAHYGDTGKEAYCTVMSALQTPSQVKSAAMPQHFLIDIPGHPGDSGSLISSAEATCSDRDLLGIYLGQADCEDQNGLMVTYGYALDLKQASELMGVDPDDLRGEYND